MRTKNIDLSLHCLETKKAGKDPGLLVTFFEAFQRRKSLASRFAFAKFFSTITSTVLSRISTSAPT